MKKKPDKLPALSLFTGHTPSSMRGMMAAYLEALQVKGQTEASVESRAPVLNYFAAWCEERGIQRAAEVTRPILQRYQRWLFYFRKKNGKPLGMRTQYTRISEVTLFFRWLTRNNFILYNPASELELPRTEKRLPKAILTTEEVERVLAQPDLRDPLGVRDRAIMEVLYSTGIRRMELAGLSIFDIDQSRKTIMVRLGKGKKDRVVPVGERAMLWVEKYLREVRPRLVMEPDDGFLFLTGDGLPLTPGHLSDTVRSYVDAAGIGKKGSCHLFRHTMATLMLEGGADTRFIQQMLGHENLASTQLYTQVSIKKLKDIHTATHPGAKLERKERARAAVGREVPDRGEAAARDGAGRGLPVPVRRGHVARAHLPGRPGQGVRGPGRHRQARLVPPVPAHDGDAHAGGRRRHPLHPADARARAARLDPALHARLHREAEGHPHGDAPRGEDGAEGPGRWRGGGRGRPG